MIRRRLLPLEHQLHADFPIWWTPHPKIWFCAWSIFWGQARPQLWPFTCIWGKRERERIVATVEAVIKMDTQTIDRLLSTHPITRKFFRGVFPADAIARCTSFPCAIVVNEVWVGNFGVYRNLPHRIQHSEREPIGVRLGQEPTSRLLFWFLWGGTARTHPWFFDKKFLQNYL